MKNYGDSHIPPQPTPNKDVERIADSLLVDAMLKGYYQDNAETTRQRINKACQQLEASQHIPSFRWSAGLSTGLAAIIIIAFIFVLSSPQHVQADFGSVLAAFDIGDKTYQINISSDTNEPARSGRRGRRRSSQRPSFKPPRRGLSNRRLDDATLYVRDSKYVLSCRGPRGGKITKGFNGKESWQVSPWGTAKIGHDPNVLESEFPDQITSLLFLNLRDTLHQIREHYDLSGPIEGSLEDGQTHVHYYIAERIGRGKTPRQIELWVDPLTNEPQQIACSVFAFSGPRNNHYTLQIRLVSAEPLPENWFTHEVHTRPAL